MPYVQEKPLGDDEAWRTSLTDDEVGSITYYKQAGYETVQGALRTGVSSEAFVMDLGGFVKTDDLVANIDNALSRSVLNEDATLFRGRRFRPGQTPEAWSGMQPGSVITEPGYSSTTLDRSVAETFAKGPGENFLLEIEAPKGTMGARVDPLSPMFTESEVLLPRNTALEVVSVNERADGVRHVIARPAGPPPSSAVEVASGESAVTTHALNDAFDAIDTAFIRGDLEGDVAFYLKEDLKSGKVLARDVMGKYG